MHEVNILKKNSYNLTHHLFSENSLVILVVFLIGIIFSISWLYPLYIQIKSKGEFSYVPIRYAPHIEDDAYFYYSHIREIIDGKFPSGDPCTYENKDKLPLHISYSFSLLMCSLGGLITKNTAHAYYFNYFVYPALNFIVIYYLFYLIINSKYLSIFSSVLVIFLEIPFRPKNLFYFMRELSNGGNLLNISQLLRTPDILFTNIHIFTLTILLFLIVEKKRRSLFLIVSLIFCLGISSLVSAQNFFVSYVIYFFIMLMNLKDRILMGRLFKYLFISLAISVPGVIFLIKTYPLLIKAMPDMFRTPGFYFSGITLKFFIAGMKLLFLPFLFLLFVVFPHKKFILSVLFSVIAIYLFLTFTSGTYASGKIIRRGAELLVACLVIGALIVLILDTINKKRLLLGISSKKSFVLNLNVAGMDLLNNKVLRKKIRIALVSFSIFFLIYCLFNQYQIYKARYKYYNAPEFKSLYLWSMNSTMVNEVALTLDFDLLTNLLVYSPLNVYIPQAVLSPASSQERYERFYETMKFYGITPDKFRSLLNEMRPHIQLSLQDDYFQVRMALMELVLFYGRFDYIPMSEPEKENMLKEYAHIYGDKDTKLTFKADYLIISKFDESLLDSGSAAEKIARNNRVVFQNSFYKVFRIYEK